MGGGTANGTPLYLSTYSGSSAQLWSRTSSQGGALYAVGAGKCLEVPGWNNGTQAVIHSCSYVLSASQIWVYHPIAQTFTVNSPSGPKCLEAAGGGTMAGTGAVINDCTGAASQRWARNFGNSTITNVNSGLVLNVTGGGTTDGTAVQLATLGSPVPGSEKWVWSLS